MESASNYESKFKPMKKQEKVDEVKIDDSDLLILFDMQKNIELLKENKIEKEDCLEEFLLNVEKLKNSKDDEKLIRILDDISKKVYTDINKEIDYDLVSYLENLYEEIESLTYEDDTANDYNFDEIPIEDYTIDVVDEVYKKLYNAIEKNDVKKITLYRGKVIRLLKKNQKKIDAKYKEVECLVKIKKLLNKNKHCSIDDIKELLDSSSDKKYINCFRPYLDNIYSFRKAFRKFYKRNGIGKIALYKEALSDELKEHSKVLKDRYSKEFLDQKGTLPSLVTVLPNAVGLSIQKMANTINQLKEARTNKRKIAKIGELVSDSLRVVGTPVIYLEKFVVSNWYALYVLYKGYLANKNEVLKEEEQPVEEKPEVKEEEPIEEKPETTAVEPSEEVSVPEEEVPQTEVPPINVVKPSTGLNPDAEPWEQAVPEATPVEIGEEVSVPEVVEPVVEVEVPPIVEEVPVVEVETPPVVDEVPTVEVEIPPVVDEVPVTDTTPMMGVEVQPEVAPSPQEAPSSEPEYDFSHLLDPTPQTTPQTPWYIIKIPNYDYYYRHLGKPYDAVQNGEEWIAGDEYYYIYDLSKLFGFNKGNDSGSTYHADGGFHGSSGKF